ncbi:Abortive infection protein [Shewanella denitrificans OS217]|uniref:Abortive infection protein n=1 Tax=Shewanella denitrificans (strain OS217 / ATCC BAA-1090 / DSM 15013) TaxID=318161 RepID=Q12MY4_SHEDO|nr:CPBP family intramembrane glutamic endopeptidase [Shewanella denitrificans]ABE55192.1 Abortive infection protein [Shewanella denitrificans OS217]
MKNIFFNNNQVRNGWWILIFIALVAITRPIYKPIKQGLGQLGFTEQMLEPVSFLLLLLVTWICIKVRKESLSDVGMGVNKRWFKHFFVGTFAGLGMMFATVALIWFVGGVTFELDENRNWQVLSYGFYLFLVGSLVEEILHRGFIFQRLIDGIGVWGAQLLIASLFVLGHWGNPGMQGTTQVFASLDLFIGSLVLGLAYLKTRSLALPIGLHLGWNWAQGNILGFGVSGFDKTGWFKPVFHGMEEWMTGGDFGPEASMFSVLISIITLVILIRWKGNVDNTNTAKLPIAEGPATA